MTILLGDNLPYLKEMETSSIDLIYLDPPFNSNVDYLEFADRWDSMEAYVEWLRVRTVEMHRLLKPTGSLYLHCDWHASHYLKVMLDHVFGHRNFLNNIVWCYGLGGSSNRYWPRKHDDILWYAKCNGLHYFDPPRMDATSVRMKGQTKKVVDYWDIPSINNMARERTGYPTQKPELLLERIIVSSSCMGDTVLDPFMGSGTTLVVADRLGRSWVGIDTSAIAADLTRERLSLGVVR